MFCQTPEMDSSLNNLSNNKLFENKHMNKLSDDPSSNLNLNYNIPTNKHKNKDVELQNNDNEFNDNNYQTPIIDSMKKNIEKPSVDNDSHSFMLNLSSLPENTQTIQNKEALKTISETKSPHREILLDDKLNIPNNEVNSNEEIINNHEQNEINYININNTLDGVSIEITKNKYNDDDDKLRKNNNQNTNNHSSNNKYNCLYEEEEHSNSSLDYINDNKCEKLNNSYHVRIHSDRSFKVKINSYKQENDETTSPLINETSLENSYIGLENENHQIDPTPLTTKPRSINDFTISEISNTEILQENPKADSLNHKDSIKLDKNNSLLYQLDNKNNNKNSMVLIFIIKI